ncbi:MAG: putative lipopolysaccharide heptosyltransferase III [Paludibacterium sp.]|uniref:putative lipopolysaccharide heptosyltransferase III n=1 Tax=Paludibacterium sp. TaxID=1917523 RepID=UPI0025EE8C48|nr:putative lipopolysaccharide heptosyltransferase III [Paludibacterium sp.]MBV8046668.1 putative lipopolysaccharide heptosyltransferase III [Paludibacterium sp.]MBV8649579.1 putative lipopolysaccharide heptosyltransferase III [Paludibacterium sp.]
MTAPIAPPGRILLIKLRHHGDVLLTTPVISTLKHHYPDAEVDVLVYQETAPMLSRHPDVSQLHCLERGRRGWRKLAHLVGLYRRLAARRYDWVIDLSDQWNGALLTRLLKPREAVGLDYPKRRNKYWRRCFTRLAPMAERNTLHTVEQNLVALEILGVQPTDDSRRCTMAYSQEDREQVRSQLASLGVHGAYIVAHPPARWFFKCWEDERFAAVIQSLADDGWPVIVTGGASDQEMTLVGNVMSHVQSPRVHSLAGQLSLNTLAALIDGARLFIGVDSVPMHMAAALQTDCIALFGPSKLNEWSPWMARSIVLHAADYAPLPDPDTVDTSTDERYLSAIPVDDVLSAAQRLLRPSDATQRRG